MESLEIVPVGIDHLEDLQGIGRTTFKEAFSAENAEESLAKYLEEGFSRERLSSELNNKESQFYFAKMNGNILGYLKLNTGQAQTELKDAEGLEIERIYVLQAFLGKKVGQALYEKAITVAREMNMKYVWLGVWENNLRAIQFYSKNGFVAFDKHFFKLGDEEQTDLLMKKVL